MKHHKNGILGDYIRLVIHWVEDMVINVSYLLDTKLNITLQESKMKRVKFFYPDKLQKNIDLYQLSVAEPNMV